MLFACFLIYSLSLNAEIKENFFCENPESLYSEIVIRQANDKDVKQITNLLSMLTHRAYFHSNTEIPKIPNSTILLIAEDNKNIIGTIAMHIWDRIRPSSSKTCYLHDFIVCPSYRGKGIGKALLKKAIDLAKKEGIGKIELACDEKLVGLYIKFGFRPMAIHLVRYLEG